MNQMARDFFVAGGALRSKAPSYVERPADRQLREQTSAGRLGYVLTTRQMGKTSLMVRTAAFLQEQGVHTALIDLTSIGTAPIDEWYLSLLDDLQSQLPIDVDVEEWWKRNNNLSHVRRFTKFIQEVIPKEVNGRVCIFVDEIDSVLNLDFSDDFFAAVRSIYNVREITINTNLPSFVLIGVATPGDLISDPKRTPFNVGERVDLSDFTLAEAKPLAIGLHQDSLKAEVILGWITEWTGGHPYLTQRMCRVVAESENQEWTKRKIAKLVEATFLGETSRYDSNLPICEQYADQTGA